MSVEYLKSLDGITEDCVSEALSNSARLLAVESSGWRDGIPEERFDRCTRLAAQALRCPVAFIALAGSDDLYMKSAYGGVSSGLSAAIVDTVCQYVVAAAAPVLLSDMEREPRLRQTLAYHQGFRSYAGVPLRHRGQVIGVLCVMQETLRLWTAADLEMLQDLARLAIDLLPVEGDATADHALQYALVKERHALQHHRELVHKLVYSFLGKTPTIAGWDIGALYQPAFEADRVGGDFYDFIRLGGSRLGVIIGDVCGKGIAAAVYTARIICFMRCYAREIDDPTRVLHMVNRAMLEDLQHESLFATLFYGILDCRTGELRYANAGHLPPVLCGPGEDEPERLAVTGPVLGVIADATFEAAHHYIHPGSSLVLVTDGITEAAHSLEGDGELILSLRETQSLSARSVAYQVMEHARQQAHGQLADDAAVVILRHKLRTSELRRTVRDVNEVDSYGT